jgi:hypothetical protein
MSEVQSKRAARIEAAVHYLTAFVVFMKGIDKIETPGKTVFGLIFIAIALLIVFGTIFHHRFERLLKYFKTYTFIFEAIVWSIMGYLYLKEGRNYIQYACFFAAIGYFIVGLFFIRKTKSLTTHH